MQFPPKDGKAMVEAVAMEMRRKWIQWSFKQLTVVIEEGEGNPIMIDYMAGEKKVSSTEMKRFSLRRCRPLLGIPHYTASQHCITLHAQQCVFSTWPIVTETLKQCSLTRCIKTYDISGSYALKAITVEPISRMVWGT